MPYKFRAIQRATKRFEMRMTEEEMEQLRTDAEVAGVTLSELVRRRSLGRPVNAAIDMTAIRELRRLGGLQKLTMKIAAQHDGIVGECIATIQALRAAVERIVPHDR